MRFGCLLAVAALCFVSACAKAPPNLSPAGSRALQGKQALEAIQALSQTAVNLNAEKGALHLTDRATAYVRDFALSATVAVQGYVDGHDTLTTAMGAFMTLQRQLKAEPSLPPALSKVLTVVSVALQALAEK